MLPWIGTAAPANVNGNRNGVMYRPPIHPIQLQSKTDHTFQVCWPSTHSVCRKIF